MYTKMFNKVNKLALRKGAPVEATPVPAAKSSFEYFNIRFPVSVADIQAVYRKMSEEDALCNQWLSVRDQITYIDTLYRVKDKVGYHPYLQKKIRSAKLQRAAEARDRRLAQREHEERQAQWLAGGKQRHYLQKWGKFGGPHDFLLNAIEKMVGASTRDVECWDEQVRPKWLDAPSRQKMWRCDQCNDTAFACAEGFCVKLLWAVEPCPEPVKAHRSIMLLYKLRAIISKLRNTTYAEYNRCVFEEQGVKYTHCTPQMEEPHHEENLDTITTGNVVLTEENSSGTCTTAEESPDVIWNKLSSNEIDSNYKYLTDRFTLMSEITWVTTDPRDKELLNLELPTSYIKDTKIQAGTMPIFLPFKIFHYCRTDIEIKVHINSNKFQVGQLQVSWQYMAKYMENCDMKGVFYRSQLPHSIISAGSSNEVTLYIPYKFLNPYMSTKYTKDGLDPVYMGNLYVTVLSPLRVSANGPASCYGSVFIRFPKCIFTGMRDGSIDNARQNAYDQIVTNRGTPQMMSIAAGMVASKVIDKVIGDRNCDNATDTRVPAFIVPTGAHSWSAGTGLTEPLHNLRLDGSCPGVGRTGIDSSETSIGVPCRTFGLYKVLEWSTDDRSKNKRGYCLDAEDAHPQLTKKSFQTIEIGGGLKKYTVPPIVVVSSLYQQWRGSLEFRFDFVCSQFHTGRLLIAYIPGLYGEDCNVTLEQARNSPHVVFSLQDSNTLTFTVPYISDKPWWYRKYSGGQRRQEEHAPSKVVVFVLNPLVTMESVSSKIEILLYVRGGPDFELSVPVQPSIGLGYNNINVIPIEDKTRALDGHFPWRVSNWNGFNNSKTSIIYYGNDITGSACMMFAPPKVYEQLKLDEAVYYKADDADSCRFIVKKGDGEALLPVRYIVLRRYAEWCMGIPFGSDQEAMAKKCAVAVADRKDDRDMALLCNDFVRDDSSTSTGNPLFSPVIFKKKDALENNSDNEFEHIPRVVTRQGDDRIDIVGNLQPVQSLPSTSCGVFNYRENFSDLKDICRRYQLYCMDFAKLRDKQVLHGEAFYQVPIIPGGLELPLSSDERKMWNNIRDGPIPIVCSGYIFYRGSLRFRLLFTGNISTLGNVKVWVQHRPDQIPNYGLKPRLSDMIQEQDKYKNHGYGFYVQDLNVNSIIEIEIPFYQQGMYGLSPRLGSKFFTEVKGDILDYVGLGDLFIGSVYGTLGSLADMGLQIYYSFGDDFSLSTFKGFPSIVFNDEVNPISFKPQMFSSFVSGVTGGLVGAMTTTKAGEGLVKEIVTDFGAAVSEKLEPEVTRIGNELKEDIAKFKFDLGDIMETAAVTNALGNLLHILANPTATTVAISLCNVITSILAGGVSILVKCKDHLLSFFTKYWHIFASNFQRAEDDNSPVRVQPQSGIGVEWYESDELKGILSLIFTAVAGIIGYMGSAPHGYFNTMRNIAITTSVTSNILNFLKAISEVIGKCFKFCVGVINPEARLQMLLDEKSVPEVMKWFEEVDYLLDARNKARMTYDKKMMDRVFDAAVFGSLLITNKLDKYNPAGKIIIDTYRRICDLRNDLIERGAHPDVRFECYPIFFTGDAGIGKSYLATEFSMSLLEAINYQCSNSPIYYITPGLKHWSGCVNPAVLVSDDLFQVKGTIQEEELANLFKICSSSVLNPPMAAVADKERRLNPYIYLMFCNHAFPDLGSIMTCADAVYRRRKYLIKAEFTPAIKAKYGNIIDASQIRREDMANFGHLQFSFAFNPKDPRTEYTNPMPYKDMLAVVAEKFKVHYTNERDNFVRRMRMMYRLDPNFRTLDLFEEMPTLKSQISLLEQRDLMKETIRDELIDLEDPFREEPYIEKFMRKFKLAWKYQMGKPEYWNRGKQQWREETIEDSVLVTPDVVGKDVLDIITYEIEEPDVHDQEFLYGMRYIDKTQCLFPGTHEFHRMYDKCVDYSKTLTPIEALKKMLYASRINPEYFKEITRYGSYDHISPVDSTVFGMVVTGGVIDIIDCSRFKIQCPELKPQVTLRFFLSGRVDITGMYEGHIGEKSELRQLTNEVFDDDGLKFLLLRYVNNIYNWRTLHRILSCNGDAEKLDKLLKSACELEKNRREQQNWDDYDCITIVRMFASIFVGDPEIKLDAAKVKKLVEDMNLNPEKKGEFVAFMQQSATVLGFMFGEALFGCSCSRKYVNLIKNMHKCYYYVDNKSFTITNSFGLKEYFKECDHAHSVYQNQVFRMLLFSYYNKIHQADINKGVCDYFRVSGLEFHKSEAVYLKKWYEKMYDNTRIVWHKHVGPRLGPMITFIIEHLPTILLYLSYLCAILGIGYALCQVENGVTGLWNGAKNMFGKEKPSEPPTFKGESHNYFKFDTAKPQARKANNVPADRNFEKQSAFRNQALHTKVINNTVLLNGSAVIDGRRQVCSARCLMLAGRKMLVLRHYFEEMAAIYKAHPDATFTLYFNCGGRSSNAVIGAEDIFADVMWADVCGNYQKSNFGIVNLPKYIPLFKNILTCFATQAMHANILRECDFLSVGGTNSFDMVVNKAKNFIIDPSDITSEVHLDSVYTYRHQGRGLCGSVLICNSLCNGNGGIFAMHVAGNEPTGVGIAEPLYREFLEGALGLFKSQDPKVIEMPLEPLEKEAIVLDANLMMYGCVPPSFAHRESGKTKILPSLIAGVYPVTTAPNPLKPGDPRQPPGSHPLRDGCEKHGSGNVVPFKGRVMELAVDHLANRLNQVIGPVRAEVKPLDYQQACCGDNEVPHFEALNWKTSEGFPLKNMRPTDAHDKRWLFKLTEERDGYRLDGFHPLLENQLKIRDKCFQNNEKCPVVYEDCLKDCRLPHEKCKIPGKTRIFSIAPISCTIDIRRYLGDYCASFKNSRIKNSCGIGINPDSVEWTQLVAYLNEVSDKWITLDYSNFGPCLMSQAVAGAIDTIVEWHRFHNASEEHVNRVKWILECDILNPVHLCDNVVYGTINGIASGSPVTGEINSLSNLLYIYNIWYEIMEKAESDWKSFYYFDIYCRVVVYGDDLIMSVSDEVLPYFNAITIKDAFSFHGITVTSAQKDAELAPFGNIMNSTFLKRGFYPHPSRASIWLAPVDVHSIQECANWIKQSNDDADATLQNCTASLDLAYGHGPAFFKIHADRIIRALNEKGLVLNYKTWLARDTEIFGTSYVDVEALHKYKCYPWYFYDNLDSASNAGS